MTVTILEQSNELTTTQRLAIKLAGGKPLDAVSKDVDDLKLDVTGYAIVDVKTDDDQFEKLCLFANGEMFTTGSKSFMETFKIVWDELIKETDVVKISVCRKESTNYKGKDYLTCVPVI